MSAVLVTSPDLNAADHSGETALLAACAGGHLSVALLLIQAKADVNKPDSDLVTPLMRAADQGNAELAAALLAAGAKPDPKDVNGQTATDWAVFRGDEAGRSVAAMLKGP